MLFSDAYNESLWKKGFLLGAFHCLTPDHLSALSTLSVGGSWRRAFTIGVRWGIGHSIGLLFVTVAFIAMKGQLDLKILGRWCDAAVGAFMLCLGAVGVTATVRNMRDRAHKKRQEGSEDDESSSLIKVPVELDDLHVDDLGIHAEGIPPDCRSWFWELDTKDPLTQRLASVVMGLLHGTAGPMGVLAVLPTVEMTRWQSSCIYLGSFVVASTISMGFFAACFGEVTRRIGARAESVEYGLRLFSSFAAIVVGAVWLSLSILGRLSDVMGHP